MKNMIKKIIRFFTRVFAITYLYELAATILNLKFKLWFMIVFMIIAVIMFDWAFYDD